MNSDLNALAGRKIWLEPKTKAICLKTHKPWIACNCSDCCLYGREEIWPDFVNDMGQAWRLVEWMRGQRWTFSFWFGRLACAKFLVADNDVYTAEHENPATAICLAFCAANGIAVEQREEVRG